MNLWEAVVLESDDIFPHFNARTMLPKPLESLNPLTFLIYRTSQDEY